MQEITTLAENLFVFLFIIIIGLLIGYKKYVSKEFKDDLTFLLLKVTLPAMIFNAIARPFNGDMMKSGLYTFILALIGFTICFVVGYIFMKVFKVKEERQGIWLMGTTFSNVGFMGFPVIHAMYGENGLFLTSFVNIAFNISFYSIGVFILTKGQEQKSIDWKDMFVNNIMFAVLLGLFIYFTQISIPDFARRLVTMVGNMTTPLSMLIIGLTLSEYPLKEIFNQRLQYALSFVRLLAAPLVIILFFKGLPIEVNELMVNVLVILNAMPIAANTTLLAHEYGGDYEFAAKSTTLSTVLSLLTLPLIFLFI